MKTRFKFYIMCLVCVCVMACSSSTPINSMGVEDTSGTGVGTVVNNPTKPQLKISEFAPAWDDVVTMPQFSFTLSGLTEFFSKAETEQLRNGAKYMIIVQHSLNDVLHEYKLFELFGRAAAKGLQDSGIEGVTDETKTITATPVEEGQAKTILDSLSIMDVVIDANPEYIRMFLRDSVEGKTYGTYLVKTDENNFPVKGLFVYVTPEFVAQNLEKKPKGVTALAFDLTGEQDKLIIRKEVFSPKFNHYIVTQDLYECDHAAGGCGVLHLDIVSEAPLRHFGSGSMFFSWDAKSQSYCITPTLFKDNVKIEGEPNRLVRIENKEIMESCEQPETGFENKIFAESDLFLRYADTVPAGGTALSYFSDWNQITPELIDACLSAYQYTQ